MKVLVACEFSGVVRDAFTRNGHDAMSCDLLRSERPGAHYIGDVRDILNYDWDLMIAHPPCTHLATSGARWFPDKYELQMEALQFVRDLLNAPIPRIALENPVGMISTAIRKPDQVIHPWQFGHDEEKATCLWLKGLPHLIPTNLVGVRDSPLYKINPSDARGYYRSRTYRGQAEAMANQWGRENYSEAELLESKYGKLAVFE